MWCWFKRRRISTSKTPYQIQVGERVHPITLETIERSADLPSGGHLWCGGAVAHSNGDLYMVNGRYMHRLSYCNKLAVVAEQVLPHDHPYNSVLILSDGNLITKTLGHEPKQPSTFVF